MSYSSLRSLVTVANLFRLAKGSIHIPSVISSTIRLCIGLTSKVFLLGIAHTRSIRTFEFIVTFFSTVFFRASSGFSASSGITQQFPTRCAPGILFSLHNSWTRRGAIPHFSAVSFTLIKFIMPPSKRIVLLYTELRIIARGKMIILYVFARNHSRQLLTF